MSDSHQAKKRFGQHFLHDQNVIERILRALNPQPGETLVEIGPGLGALTLPLLARIPLLTAIELDRDVLPQLTERSAACSGQLKIIQADALTVDYATLAPAQGKLRLVGNLPYNISTPLLFQLLRYAGQIQDMHFMLQKEVVDRMCAEPDTNDYGRLTVALAARAECHSLFRVGPGSFSPPPKVDSAVVRVLPRPAPFPLGDFTRFDRLVAAAFSQRRKTLANALKGLLPADAIRAAGVEPGLRAEALPPEAFGRLAMQLPA